MKFQLPFLFLAATLIAASAFNSSAGIITTYAGNGVPDYAGDGGPATNAAINSPWGLALDPAGNLYVADGLNPVVRRVDHATGIITTYAGTGAVGNAGDGGPATNALFTQLTSLATDLSGNLYICDWSDARIRKVDRATSIITTVAGIDSLHQGFRGDGGPATNAYLLSPQGVAVDVQGNTYIADTDNHIIRKVDAVTGIINTIAGDHTHSGITGDGGPATSARLTTPIRLAVDASDNLFILDEVAKGGIRRVDAQTGIITKVAGGGTGNGASGSATNADLETANDLAVDNLGGLYIGGMTNVWKVDLNLGTISIIAGGLTTGYAGDGGPATNALVDFVLGIAVSGSGDVFISDNSNARVRRIASDTIPLYLQINILTNGLSRLTWSGSTAAVLETSTNLAPNSWSPAGAPTYLPDGTVRLDLSPTNPARFFRLKSQ